MRRNPHQIWYSFRVPEGTKDKRGCQKPQKVDLAYPQWSKCKVMIIWENIFKDSSLSLKNRLPTGTKHPPRSSRCFRTSGSRWFCLSVAAPTAFWVWKFPVAAMFLGALSAAEKCLDRGTWYCEKLCYHRDLGCPQDLLKRPPERAWRTECSFHKVKGLNRLVSLVFHPPWSPTSNTW